MEHWWDDTDRGKPKYLERLTSAILFKEQEYTWVQTAEGCFLICLRQPRDIYSTVRRSQGRSHTQFVTQLSIAYVTATGNGNKCVFFTTVKDVKAGAVPL
jgi:hypothetical protein